MLFCQTKHKSLGPITSDSFALSLSLTLWMAVVYQTTQPPPYCW